MPYLTSRSLMVYPQTTDAIFHAIEQYVRVPHGFFHIVSVNPEIVVLAHQDREFKEVVQEAAIQIMDGIGVVWALKLLHGSTIERQTGVDIMQHLLERADKHHWRVLFLGGATGIAEELVHICSARYQHAHFKGVQGIKAITHPKKEEEERIFDLIHEYKPHIMFVSFGSPAQELWIFKHQDRLRGMVCMGVGGAFDFVAGKVPRASETMQKLGLEWLYRLIQQPWRWQRQLRLITFIGLIGRALLRRR